jgi:O-6-methylguanine DNA methyltransferase
MVVADSTTICRGARLRSPSPSHVMAAIPTAWGLCGIVWKNHEHESSEGFAVPPSHALLCRICTPGLTIAEWRRHTLATFPDCQEVLGDKGRFHPQTVPEWFPNLVAFLQSYYAAELRLATPFFQDHWAYWQPRLDWRQLTPFQRRVLELVAAIPTGTHVTYGQIAQRLGRPSAARAVGSAIGANPWPVLIPCHRVLGAGGQLTGFSAPGGIRTKRRMLDLERQAG